VYARFTRDELVRATRPPFNPGSPQDVLRGGALEPDAHDVALRHASLSPVNDRCDDCVRHVRTFLSQTGPQSQSEAIQAGHHHYVIIGRA
jgi:hypothetical protein